MPIPWAAAAKVIPWGEVIAAAPGIVKGARDLWKRSARSPEPETDDGLVDVAGPSAEERIGRLESQILELDQDLQASSGLITQLAEQNQRLVVAIDRLKRRLALAAVLAGIATLIALWALLAP